MWRSYRGRIVSGRGRIHPERMVPRPPTPSSLRPARVRLPIAEFAKAQMRRMTPPPPPQPPQIPKAAPPPQPFAKAPPPPLIERGPPPEEVDNAAMVKTGSAPTSNSGVMAAVDATDQDFKGYAVKKKLRTPAIASASAAVPAV